MTMDYSAYAGFLAAKTPSAQMTGVDARAMPSHMSGFREAVTAFLIKAGRGGCYLDTGLGKSSVELEWCDQAAEATNGRSLLFTPLAVARQIERMGLDWGYQVRVITDQSQAGAGTNICNYDRAHLIDPDYFGAVALDEAGILKSLGGKTSQFLIDAFAGHRFRLSSTATPAPNDHMELGQQSAFLGIMSSSEMLSRFFINDTSQASQQWRLKGHAVTAFWDWMASWSRMAQMPSDLGYSDDGFVLPPLNVVRHRTGSSKVKGEGLFAEIEMSATKMYEVKRQTVDARVRIIADLVAAEPDEPWVIWCDTDLESEALARAIPGAMEVKGSMEIERKEANIAAFLAGRCTRLITKPSICGWGLNLQHCARTAFVGRSFSYELWYQAVRRFWRFGQTRQVDVHIAVAEGEDAIGRVIDRKAADHLSMKVAMAAAMKRAMGRASAVKVAYNPTHEARLPTWL